MVSIRTWTFNKVVILALIAAFARLFVDLGFEHVGAVRHYSQARIPIGYSGLMVALAAPALAGWERGGRLALLIGFAAAFIVRGSGFWFHSREDPPSGVRTVLSAWTKLLRHEDVPPPLAPLAFAGLGLLGTLACARRYRAT